MVIKYIFENNNVWEVPLILFKSFIIITFQFISKKEIVKKIDKKRKIIIFPNSVISRMFLYTKIPDRKEVNILRRELDEKSVFLDIGANIGSYSVLMSDLTKRIYAFEPSLDAYLACKKNFELNNLPVGNVFRVAISDKEDKAWFADFGGLSPINCLTNSKDGRVKVNTTSIDKWVEKNIKYQDFNLLIKIDVEGQEIKVIKGLEKMLKERKVKCMVLEVWDRKSKVFKVLKSYGYGSRLISNNNYFIF